MNLAQVGSAIAQYAQSEADYYQPTHLMMSKAMYYGLLGLPVPPSEPKPKRQIRRNRWRER